MTNLMTSSPAASGSPERSLGSYFSGSLVFTAICLVIGAA